MAAFLLALISSANNFAMRSASASVLATGLLSGDGLMATGCGDAARDTLRVVAAEVEAVDGKAEGVGV